MANSIVQLYDGESNPVDPKTQAQAVSSGVVTSGNTVYQDLEQLLAKYNTLAGQVTGSIQISQSLGIQVFYDTNNISDASSVASQPFSNSNIIIPSANAPYAWQKTIYKWGETVVKTTYTIVATALFPETQMMFAVGPLDAAIGGPQVYEDNTPDQTTSSIKWYTYPYRDISNDAPCAYIATRTRAANETWQGKTFHAAKYGQYPIS